MSEDENEDNNNNDTPTAHTDASGGSASRAPSKKPEAWQRRVAEEEPNLIADDGKGDKAEGASEHFEDKSNEEEDEEKHEGARGLVLFDFDGTLIEQDSLRMLVTDVVGDRFRAYLLFVTALWTAFIEAITTRREFMDNKSAFKVHWLTHTIGGTSLEHIEHVAEKMRDKLVWRDKLVHDMKACAEKGYDVVVATGALNIYMPILLRGLPVTAMICAHAEVDDHGKLTGRLTGGKPNCNPVRREKRVRVQDYINQRGPFSHIIGYGNLPDDGPMLALCDEFFII